MDLFNEKQDGLGNHNSATSRHKPTNSRYGPYLYSTREQQNNVNKRESTGKSNYYNNPERDYSNLRNFSYALSQSNMTYEKDRQDNNYGAQTIQAKGNSYYNSYYNCRDNCATSSTNRTENVDKSIDKVKSQNTNYKTLSQWDNKEGNCSRNATITSQNYYFATNTPVELNNVQQEDKIRSRWENSVNIPNSNISNSNTCTTQSDSGLLQSYPFSFNQKICPSSVPNSLDWQSILRINKSTSVGMQVNKGNIESVLPYSGTQSHSGLFQSYPFSFNQQGQQACPSVPNTLDWPSIARMNKNTNVGMRDKKGYIESVASYSGSSQLSSYNELDDDSAESSVSDLQSMLSSGEDTDEEMKQNSKPRFKKTIRKTRWEQTKRQMKQERPQARQSINPPSDPNCIALKPVQALKLLTPDGTEFLKILGEATNLKIAANKDFNDSYTFTMEGPEEFKCKAKKAIERFCNPFLAAKPNWIVLLSVDCDITSVQKIFTKLNDYRTNWKMSAEHLYRDLLRVWTKIMELKERNSKDNNFNIEKPLKKLKETEKFRYKVVNAIILVILKVADAPVHIQVLKQWIEDGKETGNNSIENAFNYIFRNDTNLDIDYKQVIQMLPQGVNFRSLIEKVGHLMTSGVAICEKFQWDDKLKLLKRLYADIIINNYSDESINNLDLNVINLQQWSAVAVLWGGHSPHSPKNLAQK